MQLGRLGNNTKPIVIAIGLLAGSTLLYSDIDQYSEVTPNMTSSRTNEYLSFMEDPDIRYAHIKRHFEAHYEAWRQETAFLSSSNAIINNSHFQAILAIGKEVTPFIIEKIEQEPSTLVWSLNLIFNRKITNKPNTTITEACELWVKAIRG